MDHQSCCCCGVSETKKRSVLLYACSGGANVAEMADATARQLMRGGRGAMLCLAGIDAVRCCAPFCEGPL